MRTIALCFAAVIALSGTSPAQPAS
ncbi:MAG: hypothetical protein QOJ39_3282, partial [Candidatus Eremiobacteraeota bacterium]|nr:hypothetical protein [Candidatus Eremiobacteraeota bacterium]